MSMYVIAKCKLKLNGIMMYIGTFLGQNGYPLLHFFARKRYFLPMTAPMKS